MPEQRCLIVNADDFGQSHGVNAGIIQAHREGILTSASLMVRWDAAAEAAAYARAHPHLSVGLHLDLGEWAYRHGAWKAIYQVVGEDDAEAVAKEVQDQLARFRRLVGRDPSHIDSHQHAHRREPLHSIARRIAGDLNVPLRHYSADVRYCGAFYGQTGDGKSLPQAINVQAFISLLAELPPGITEVCCHPAALCDLDSMYAGERLQELSTLCDPRLRAAIQAYNIELCSFVRAVVQ